MIPLTHQGVGITIVRDRWVSPASKLVVAYRHSKYYLPVLSPHGPQLLAHGQVHTSQTFATVVILTRPSMSTDRPKIRAASRHGSALNTPCLVDF